MGTRPDTAPTATTLAVVAYLDATRRDQGLTQTDLARAAGISQPSVSEIMRGEKDLNLGTFLSWCEILGLDPARVVDQQS